MLIGELSGRYGLAVNTQRVAQLPEGRRIILMGTTSNPLVQEFCARHRIEANEKSPGPEGYVLDAGKDAVLVAGSDERGAFYGFQSLRQMIGKGPSGPPIGVCPRCRGKDPTELFAQDIIRIHQFLTKKGIRVRNSEACQSPIKPLNGRLFVLLFLPAQEP